MQGINCLLRKYLPKGTDLSSCNQGEIDSIPNSLNAKPGANYSRRTPLQVFAAALVSSGQSVALLHYQPLHFILGTAGLIYGVIWKNHSGKQYNK
jgi:hypothetical protein